MSYQSSTEFYGMPLYAESDLYNPMDDNDAKERVDTDLHSAVTNAENAIDTANSASETAGAAAESVETLSADLVQEKAKIVALQTRVTNAENEIDDVRADASDMITAYNEPTATASHRYEVGDFFIYNNTLYKATATIAVGATIVPDTNCETTNVSTELIEIKVAINRGYVQVTADGVKTLSQILDSLFALADTSKISINSKLRSENAVYSCTLVGGTLFDFSGITAPVIIDLYRVRASNSAANRVSCNSDSTILYEDRAASIPESGRIFTLYY